MPYNISGVNSTLRLVFDVTFPAGFTVSEWADDADALDTPVRDLAEGGMGSGGDAVFWAVPKILEVTINIIPGCPSDINLQIAATANTAARGRIVAGDTVTATWVNNNNGKIVTFNGGRLTKAPPADSVSQNSKLKSKQYAFMFESVTT